MQSPECCPFKKSKHDATLVGCQGRKERVVFGSERNMKFVEQKFTS